MNTFSLPRKTSIAVWWIAIVGLVGTTTWIIFHLNTFELADARTTYEWGLLLLLKFVAGLLYLLPAILIELKKRWAWIAAVIILTIESLYIVACIFWDSDYLLTLVFLPFAIPFLLIFFDRRNYRNMLRAAMEASVRPTPETEPQ
jgi:hypothetical protein